MPLFDPPRHDSAETIRRALNLGVNVKMITGMSPFYIMSLLLGYTVNFQLLSVSIVIVPNLQATLALSWRFFFCYSY